jgi:hypothetical protein
LGVLLPVILRARKNAGIAVRRVNLKSCSSASSWIESLREAVNDVTWEIDERDTVLILGRHPQLITTLGCRDDPDE